MDVGCSSQFIGNEVFASNDAVTRHCGRLIIKQYTELTPRRWQCDSSIARFPYSFQCNSTIIYRALLTLDLKHAIHNSDAMLTRVSVRTGRRSYRYKRRFEPSQRSHEVWGHGQTTGSGAVLFRTFSLYSTLFTKSLMINCIASPFLSRWRQPFFSSASASRPRIERYSLSTTTSWEGLLKFNSASKKPLIVEAIPWRCVWFVQWPTTAWFSVSRLKIFWCNVWTKSGIPPAGFHSCKYRSAKRSKWDHL